MRWVIFPYKLRNPQITLDAIITWTFIFFYSRIETCCKICELWYNKPINS
nr:MAG TPA: hypothetical protein [Caudoviricetes sp.]